MHHPLQRIWQKLAKNSRVTYNYVTSSVEEALLIYRHIVLFWLKDAREENISFVCTQLSDLFSQIGGLISLEIGQDTTQTAESCDICMNALLISKDCVDEYRQTQAYINLKKQLRKIQEKFVTASFEPAQPVRRMPKLYSFVGPSICSVETMGRLLDAGMAGVRLSLLHHTIDDCMPYIDALHTAAAKRGVIPEILLDPFSFANFSDNLARSGATGVIIAMPISETILRDLRGGMDPRVRLFCKVDNREALKDMPTILKYADELIIARDGMPRHFSRYEIPNVQQRIATFANEVGRPFMVASDLLQSMCERYFPTSAELCGIHAAVQMGASSLMLTEEVSLGRYPVEAMETLQKAAQSAIEQ